jgi:hypothetical protein
MNSEERPAHMFTRKLILGVLFNTIILALPLFLPSGTLH